MVKMTSFGCPHGWLCQDLGMRFCDGLTGPTAKQLSAAGWPDPHVDLLGDMHKRVPE